jgi:hypothetical protein
MYTHSREVEHRAKVEGLEERMRVWEERQDPRAREREVEEARAKDRRIAQLTAELAAQAQLVASQQEMHENSLQALKTQNSLLSREVPHIIAHRAHCTRTTALTSWDHHSWSDWKISRRRW